MFKIGDEVWFARAGHYGVQVTCPDCAGTRRIRLVLANDEQVSIDCGGCARGYEGSLGTITEYEFKAEVFSAIVDGLDQSRDKITYKVNGNLEMNCYYSFDAADIFGTREEATERCRELVRKEVEGERDRIQRKEKDTRSWAWNASYHRQHIKDLERQLSYHKAKLSVAESKAKE